MPHIISHKLHAVPGDSFYFNPEDKLMAYADENETASEINFYIIRNKEALFKIVVSKQQMLDFVDGVIDVAIELDI